jgi:cytochrome c peroxidase
VLAGTASGQPLPEQIQIDLGRQLFFDVNLSASRRQACASCHSPALAFTDPGRNGVRRAVSVGDDGESLGTRNAPTLTYVALTPVFGKNPEGQFRGGFFIDGRAHSLADQAGQPMLDPAEMALPDKASVVARLRGNPAYLETLRRIHGARAMLEDERLYEAAIAALVSFERSVELSAFDSKYDRYLAGDYEMTFDESLGRELFFSDLTNCRHCHLAHTGMLSRRETFTSYRYQNIGVPANPTTRQRLPDHVDPGLGGNPLVTEGEALGKFRVPTLRNVAVTGPYMHNGVFSRLDTAVQFYGKYLASNAASNLNPETGLPWQAPEVALNVDFQQLRLGQPIDELRVRYLVAFLETLTDRRYEHLLVH